MRCSPPPVPSADMLLVDLPFRVHDRYAPSTDSLEGVFVQATRELPGSLLMEVDWDATTPPGTVVHVAVRVDGAPFWDATPVDEPNQPGLYLFRGDERRALGGRRRELFRRAHRVEVRAYLTFVNGAYYSGQWKQGAQLGGLRLTYRQPTQILRHEARVD